MTRKIFFGRHGYQMDNHVTPQGYSELTSIRERLAELGFVGACSVCSTETRCIETAQFLAPSFEPITLPILHAYGDWTTMGVVNPWRHPTWFPGDVWGASVLNCILENEPSDKDLAVIGHDFAASMLADQYIRLQGGDPVWLATKPKDFSFPDQGEGILVEGTSFTILEHLS